MFHKTSFRANQEFCKAFAAANVNPGRFTETAYNDHRNRFAVTRLTYVMAPTPCAPASLALLF